MDWNSIVSLISTVGFPIVACIFMAWYVKDNTEKQREETRELNNQHTKEMLAFKDEMKEALNNNTLALQKLCDKLDRKDE
jgi:hypothetical protein